MSAGNERGDERALKIAMHFYLPGKKCTDAPAYIILSCLGLSGQLGQTQLASTKGLACASNARLLGSNTCGYYVILVG